jgi:tetratricopeptide (TPR) repeat protein
VSDYQRALELGATALRQGDSREALDHFQRAVELAGDEAQATDALAMLGRTYGTIGWHGQAEAALNEALRRGGSPGALARAKMQMGIIRWQAGQLDTARYYLQEAEQELQQQGDTRSRATALGNLGMILVTRGEYQPALDALQASLALCEATGDRVGMSIQSSNLGEAYLDLGDPARARALHERAIALAEELGSESMQADALRNLGADLAALGRVEEGIAAVTRALAIARATHQQDIALQCQASLAELELQRGALGTAEQLALELQQQAAGIAVRRAHARLIVGRIQLARGEPQRALLTLESGLVDAQTSAGKMLVLRLHAALAQASSHPAVAGVHRRIAAELADQIRASLLDESLRAHFVRSALYRSVVDLQPPGLGGPGGC